MGAFATLTIPLSFTSQRAANEAYTLAYTAAGSKDVAADLQTGELTLKLQFPGNLSALASKLRKSGFAVPRRVGISVPVRSMAPPDRVPDVPGMVASLESEQNIWDVQVSGSELRAHVVLETDAAHAIYDALLDQGLIAQDVPTLPALRGL